MNNIEDIITDLKKGKMVILVDDEDRENEGDLLIAACHITPEFINFMAKFGKRVSHTRFARRTSTGDSRIR